MSSSGSRFKAFTPASSRAALSEACRAIGISDYAANLIRLGENAIYRIPDLDLVVRIARGLDVLDDARKEVAVSRWLSTTGLRAARLANYEQPIIADGRPVTFWQYIESTSKEASLTELGSTLRELHSLTPPVTLALPLLDFFGRVDARIEHSTDIPETDLDFLRNRVEELRHQYAELSFPLRECAVHGDAHTANLMKTPDGSVILIDFERFAFGHPELDLAVTAVEYGIGWYTDEEYSSFIDAYGFDVTEWSGYPVVRRISELKMVTWLMQNVSHGHEIATEFRVRLDSLRDESAPRHWRPF